MKYVKRGSLANLLNIIFTVYRSDWRRTTVNIQLFREKHSFFKKYFSLSLAMEWRRIKLQIGNSTSIIVLKAMLKSYIKIGLRFLGR